MVFAVFNDDWNEVRFNDVFERITKKNDSLSENVLTISANYGLINQEEYFTKSVASKNKNNYYYLEKGDFAYNKSYSSGYPMGAIKRLRFYDEGVVSPLYICFRTKEGYLPEYFEFYFESGLFDREIRAISQEGARNHGLLNMSVHDFFNTRIYVPSDVEQIKIVKVLDNWKKLVDSLDELIKSEVERKKSIEITMFGNKPEKKETRRLRKYLIQQTERNNGNNISDIYSVTNNQGFVNQSDQFGKIVASKEISGYKVIRKSCFAFNPSRINVGSIAYLEEDITGVLSPMYVVFKCNNEINSKYLLYYLKSQVFQNQISKYVQGSVRDSLTFKSLCDVPIPYYSLEKQEEIGKLLELQNLFIEQLVSLKKFYEVQFKETMRLLLTGKIRVQV